MKTRRLRSFTQRRLLAIIAALYALDETHGT